MGHMGNLEKEVARRIRIGKVQRGVLSAVGIAGVLLVSVVAPNTLSLLGKVLNRRSAFRIRSVASNLVTRGLISFETNGGKRYMRLTRAGQRYLDERKRYSVATPKHWDGKWRIVSFDIEQKRSAQRTRLRQTLREIGFERLQDSVWVFPYDCEDLITLLKTDYGLGKEVLYIIADTIENDRALRGRFGLKGR